MVEPADEEPRCLVLSQVVGVELLQARVPVALRRAMELLDALSDRLVEETGGIKVRTPARGWVAVWDSTLAAIQYCMRLQRELLRVDWPPTLLLRPEAAEERDESGAAVFRGLRVRQGVHLGRLEVRQDGEGQEVAGGPALIQVARIAEASHGGQVVLSEQAWRRMRGSLGGSTVLRDLGPHRFNLVHGTNRLYQVLPSGLDGRRFPPPRTRDVLRTDVLPRPRPFIGRAGDLAALAELDAFGVRFVTVVGPEGMGKSRLVRRFSIVHGARFREEGAGGVWLARLDEERSVDLIRAVGHTMQVPLVLGRSNTDLVSQLGHALDARGPMLLVIDGLGEQTGEIAEVLAQWARMAPQARFLVAAQDRLGLKGELAYDMGPIRSAELGTARSADAVRLYLDRARGLVGGAELDPEEVQRLVERLGRNPQAVELAAGQVDRLPPEALMAELSDRAPIRAVLDALWAATGEAERRVLQACAIPPGGFDRLLVDGVRDRVDVGQVGALVSRLIARGLLRDASHPGAPLVERLAMPRSVRAFILGRLPSDRQEVLQRRFADWMLRLCEPWGELAWTREGPETVARITLEWTNLVEVVRWGLAPERSEAADVDRALRLLTVLQPVFAAHGPTTLFAELLDQALERADVVLGSDPVLQVRALVARAEVRWRSGKLRQSEADLQRGRSIAERWSDAEGQGLCRTGMAVVLRARGKPEEALQMLEEARSLFAGCGAARLEAVALGSMGVVLLEEGRLEDADGCLQASVAHLRAIGARPFEAKYLVNLGVVSQRMGRADQARAIFREAVRIHQETGDARLEGITALNLGVLDYHLGRLLDAREAFRKARVLAAQVGDRHTEAACLINLGLVQAAQGDQDGARQAMLQALAIHRDAGATRDEGVVLGYLGVAQHLEGRLDGARDHYRRAISALDGGPRRFELLFTAWLAAAEAEADHGETAEQLIQVVKGGLPQVADRDLERLVEVMEQLVSVCGGGTVGEGEVAALRKGVEGDSRLALLRLQAVVAR